MSKSTLLDKDTDPSIFYDKYKEKTSPHTVVSEFKILVDNFQTKLDDVSLFTPEFNHEKTLLLHEIYFLKDLYYDDVIRFCSKFTDVVDTILRKHPGEITYTEFFHRKRYFYYMEYCISKFPNIILFPTFNNIGSTDLIKTRCVPVFFTGIITEPVYADEFILSPSEFFFHDINHSRIIYQQDEEYLTNKNISKQQLISSMKETTKLYFDSIRTIHDKNLKALMKMIIFEIVHEDGFSFVNDKICERLLKPEGEDMVERMNGQVIELVKKITPSTIGNTLFKLRCGFYDKENEPLDYIVSKEYRTISNIVLATQTLINIFNCRSVSPVELNQLVTVNSSITPIRKCLDDKMIAGKNKKTKKNKKHNKSKKNGR